MTTSHLFPLILLLIEAAVVVSASAATFAASSISNILPAINECTYTLYVRTGSIIGAGTDSKISLTLGDSSGRSVWVSSLRSWGIMGPQHDYFERDSTDVFTGLGPCIGSPICRLNVTSDGSGAHHGWFCDYIEVTSTGPHMGCSKSIFYVYQWLASDAPPYDLPASLDGCKDPDNWKSGPYVVRKPTDYGLEGFTSTRASLTK